MDFSAFVHSVVDFVRDHEVWAAPIVFTLAFAELLAFLSLLIPAWGALVGIGAVIGATDINFWPIWLAGSLGAALGDWLSFWLGYHFHDRIIHMWPLSKYPDMIPRAERFVAKWGVPGIFVGRFSVPCGRRCRWLRARSRCRIGIFNSPIFPRPLSGRRCCCRRARSVSNCSPENSRCVSSSGEGRAQANWVQLTA